MRNLMLSYRKRSQRGSILALMAAVTAGIVMLLLFFCLDTSRFLGSHEEQTNAIESAALAAAHDLSNIVIEDQNLGFIALSDYPPNGNATTAGDNYYLSVKGINTVLATVRLDMIIADLLNDNTMRACARRDYDQAMAARAGLVLALQNSIQAGGFGKDIDGNVIKPLDDAVRAYQSNRIRLARGQSKLLVKTMKLTLGCIDGVSTNTHIPEPSDYANLTNAQQDNLMYRAFINIPYNNKDFVFAALGDAVTIADVRAFRDNAPELPYLIPSIVKCEADQQFDEKDHKGKPLRRIVHAAACAEPACLVDNRPAPGSLAISFPNGSVNEIRSLYDVLTNGQVAKSPADDTQTVLAGDFTPNPMTPFALPVLNNLRPPFGQIMRVATYDWIRRGGYQLNVQALLDAFFVPLSADSASHADIFKMDETGNVMHSIDSIPPTVSLPVSNNQYYSVSGLAFHSGSGNQYDVFVKDYTYQPGRIRGGIHAGEPLGNGAPPPGSTVITGARGIDENPAMIAAFPVGPTGGALRPTYQAQGIASEIRFRLR